MNSDEAIESNNLGKAHARQGRREEALTHFQRAVHLDPEFAEARNNLAILLGEGHRFEEAIAEYRRAIELTPRYAEAYYNLGNALRSKGDAQAAINAYLQALEIRPDLVEAHSGIGNALLDQDKGDDAVERFKIAIAMRPSEAMGYNNLGVALRKAGKTAAALEALDKAVFLKADYAVAHCNRGLVLEDLHRSQEASDLLKKAVALRSDGADYLKSLVRLLRDTGAAGEAIAICRTLTSAMPNYAEAFAELSALLLETGAIDEAEVQCSKALSLNPDLPEALNTRGNILRDQGRLHDAIACYRRALEFKPDLIGVRSNLIFTLQFATGCDNAAILTESRHWADLHEKSLLGEARPHANDRRPDRVLKIGYVSPYFRLHPAAWFLLPLLANHNRSKVQIFCYSGVREADEITRRFTALDVAWRETGRLTDAELAAQIRADEIDILIDTALHMQGSRLLTFARKPAPVQVTWLGYPGTTGLSAIDYRLTDPYLDPPGQSDDVYSERSVRLPRTFWCYTPLFETPDVSSLPAATDDHITFGCFNNFHKATPEALSLWAKALGAIPRSRLLMLCPPGRHREAVQQVFERAGVAPNRIGFTPRLPHQDYLRLYARVDLCLDTVPYPGHTTSLDSLWMGVPVVTLAGQTTAGRGGVSLLSNIGLTNLIARTPDEFVNIVASLATDIVALADLREKLRDRLLASPLMNAKAFATDLEDAFADMWRTYCANGRGAPRDYTRRHRQGRAYGPEQMRGKPQADAGSRLTSWESQTKKPDASPPRRLRAGEDLRSKSQLFPSDPMVSLPENQLQPAVLDRSTQSSEGELAKTVARYRAAALSDPTDHKSRNWLGALAVQSGDLTNGIAWLRQANQIAPREARYNKNLAWALIADAQPEAAWRHASLAVDLEPGSGSALYLRARCEAALKRWAAAKASLDRALAAEPNLLDALSLRASVSVQLGNQPEAVADLDRVIAISPNHAQAYARRGALLASLRREEEALRSLDHAVALAPRVAGYWTDRGAALLGLARHDEALDDLERAIALEPTNVQAWINKGNVLAGRGDVLNAIVAYLRAAALKPEDPMPLVNAGYVLLRLGDYLQGFYFHEFRDRLPAPKGMKPLPQPRWHAGGPLEGRSVLLHYEHGLGDSIMCLRFVKQIAKAGAKVVLGVQRPLLRLAASLEPPVTAIADGMITPEVDARCSLESLPFELGVALDNLSGAPYLSAFPDDIARWAAKLGPKRRPRIGIAWRGNPEHGLDRHRSIALARLAPLFEVDAEWISLHKEIPEDEARLMAGFSLRDTSRDLSDMADTAALMTSLDLVVTVDTSVAHLGGALGAPTWLLLAQISDWRWLENRRDSPWYDSVRLYRQQKLDDWAPVLAEVVRDLRQRR